MKKENIYNIAIQQKAILENLFIIHSDLQNELENKYLIELYQLTSDILASVEK